MENLTQVLELLTEIYEAGVINVKARRVRGLIRRSRRQKVESSLQTFTLLVKF